VERSTTGREQQQHKETKTMVNRPKGKLFALFAVFAAIGLITASGAFTSVQADRTMDVSVVGDASANLGLSDAGQGYVDTGGDAIKVDLSNVNLNADTDFGAVLSITNNGPSGQTLYVQIATQNSSTSYTSSDLFEDANSLDPQFTNSIGTDIEGGDSTTGGDQLSIDSGNSTDVHITLSVPSSTSTGSFSGSIIIEASDSDLTA